jgi:hypothetical protein
VVRLRPLSASRTWLRAPKGTNDNDFIPQLHDWVELGALRAARVLSLQKAVQLDDPSLSMERGDDRSSCATPTDPEQRAMTNRSPGFENKPPVECSCTLPPKQLPLSRNAATRSQQHEVHMQLPAL